MELRGSAVQSQYEPHRILPNESAITENASHFFSDMCICVCKVERVIEVSDFRAIAFCYDILGDPFSAKEWLNIENLVTITQYEYEHTDTLTQKHTKIFRRKWLVSREQKVMLVFAIMGQ